MKIFVRRRRIEQIVITVITVGLIFGVSFGVIAYGRGYRIDINRKSLSPTGLITATSDPQGATVFVDGRRYSATNTNINIPPGWYDVKIAKEGYQSWEKRVRVQGEVVARADAMLFPANPSLYAITTNGVRSPLMSPDGSKLAYIIPNTLEATTTGQLINRAGVWVLDLADKPLGLNRDARQVVTSAFVNSDDAILTWSTDSKQLLMEFPSSSANASNAYLIDADTAGETPKPVTRTDLIIQDWKDLESTRRKEQLLSLKPDLFNIATSSMNIIGFSPDENKILYISTEEVTIPPILVPPLIGTNPTTEDRELKPSNVYVYDVKEDRNYLIGTASDFNIPPTAPAPTEAKPAFGVKTPTPTPEQKRVMSIQWLPTSRHLIVMDKDRIDIMEYDTGNRKTVYSGPFWDGFVAPWTNASKLLILTNLNPGASTFPNLYAVNIR